jgi:AraC-like DNA-binding protein
MAADPLFALGESLFADPSRLRAVERFPVLQAVRNPLHRHPDLLQLDVFLGCRGWWPLADGRIAADGPAAAVFAPGVEHGHQFQPGRAAGECLSIKLMCPARALPTLRSPVLDALAVQALAAGARRVAAAHVVGAPAQAIAHLLLLLARWPGRDAAGPGAVPFAEVADALVRRAAGRLAVAGCRPAIAHLAGELGLSPRQLGRRFHASLGCSPQEFADRMLLERARAHLLQGGRPIAAIAAGLGFASVHHFTRWFRRQAGLPPGRFRRQGLDL